MSDPFTIWLELPPTDNRCHRSAGTVRYPSKEYVEWLRHVAPILDNAIRDQLGPDYMPDTERWWDVRLVILLGSRGDATNYVKPVLDLLSGARVAETEIETAARTIGKGRVYHHPHEGLWDDDKRVGRLVLEVIGTRSRSPGVRLTCAHWHTPSDGVVRAREEAREAKAAAKRAAALARWPDPCATCGAAAGSPCVSSSGARRAKDHGRRCETHGE